MLEVWDLWFPDAGATGIAFARSRVDDQAAGILKAWWHAEDHSEWRWQVEFSNHT